VKNFACQVNKKTTNSMDHVIGKKKSVFLIITGSMYQRINLSYKLKKSRKMFFKNNILSVKEKKKNKENMVAWKRNAQITTWLV
jgi:hypothetical protein